MLKRIKFTGSFFSSYLFLYLIPLIFLLEKYRQALGTVSFSLFIYCLLLYWLGCLLFAFGFWRIFRDHYKAHLITAFLFCCNCYFGFLQSWLADLTQEGRISRYRIMFPVLFIIFCLLFYYLNKKESVKPIIGKILGLVGILLVFEKAWLVIDTANKLNYTSSEITFKPIPNSNHPDVFILVTDGYAGKMELEEVMGFKNDSFYSQLRNKGFWVADRSHSNYSITPFSMASAFSMNYLPLKKYYHLDLLNCRNRIHLNPFLSFFTNQGYIFKNYSIFQDKETKNPQIVDAFHYSGYQLLNGGTLLQHLSQLIEVSFNPQKDFFKMDSETEGKLAKSNRYIIKSLQKEKKQVGDRPKLVYGHIIAPHFPYFYDSLENYYSREELNATTRFSKPHYISYLKGVNNVLLKTIDSIQSNTAHKAVIILMSDHGFRQFNEPQFSRYFFSNLLSIYLPEQNYGEFYEGISNVNFFRAFLNQQFQQEIPMVKDSMVIYPVKGLKFKHEN